MPLIVINDEKLIPGVGQGPFKDPIEISEGLFRKLDLMGYAVLRLPAHSIHFSTVKKVQAADKTGKNPYTKYADTVEPEEETVKEVEPAAQEVSETTTEPVEEQAEDQEEPESIPDPVQVITISGKEDEIENFTKNELKSWLNQHHVNFVYKDNHDVLVSKVKDFLNK